MKYYSDKYKISKVPMNGMEFEVLNEMTEDAKRRCIENCIQHTRFLFESDTLSPEEQESILDDLKPIVRRATFSGKKSIHIIIEFSEALENICKEHYKTVWKAINRRFFKNNADTQCAEPARLTRIPNAKRFIDGKFVTQDCLLDDGAIISEDSTVWKQVWRVTRSLIAEEAIKYQPTTTKVQTSLKTKNGLCANYDKIRYYLSHSYPNISGNGDSSSSLFKALRCCLKYNDNDTLNTVLEKARRERWSEKELERMIRDIKARYL